MFTSFCYHRLNCHEFIALSVRFETFVFIWNFMVRFIYPFNLGQKIIKGPLHCRNIVAFPWNVKFHLKVSIWWYANSSRNWVLVLKLPARRIPEVKVYVTISYPTQNENNFIRRMYRSEFSDWKMNASNSGDSLLICKI